MKLLKILAVILLTATTAMADPGIVEQVPVPMVTILPTALPTAFPTPQFGAGQTLRTRTVCNSTNVEIWCTDSYPTVSPYSVPAGSCETQNYGANNSQASKGVGCIRPANTPASGTVNIWGSK